MSVRLSKFLSRVLRHRPESIGLTLDAAGWADIDALLARTRVSRADLERLVAENDKKRFEISPDGRRIRAAQGHSVAVELGLPPAAPPVPLFHGTAEKSLAPILREGLRPRGRQHVHLSIDVPTAAAVGARRGPAVVLRVATDRLAAEGQVFFEASNGVWLTGPIAPRHLSVIER